jgi:hypothetical protein
MDDVCTGDDKEYCREEECVWEDGKCKSNPEYYDTAAAAYTVQAVSVALVSLICAVQLLF